MDFTKYAIKYECCEQVEKIVEIIENNSEWIGHDGIEDYYEDDFYNFVIIDDEYKEICLISENYLTPENYSKQIINYEDFLQLIKKLK